MVDHHHYQYKVAMSCGGCSGAVERALKRLDGVRQIDISLETQLVDVKTEESLSYDKVLETIKKTGKQVLDGKTVE